MMCCWMVFSSYCFSIYHRRRISTGALLVLALPDGVGGADAATSLDDAMSLPEPVVTVVLLDRGMTGSLGVFGPY